MNALLRHELRAIIARAWTARVVRPHFAFRVVALANDFDAPVHGGRYG